MPQLPDPRATRHLGSGMTMAAVVGLFAYGGYLLDEKTGWSPLFVVLGVFLGSIGGFLHVVRVVSPEMLPWAKRSQGAHGGPPADRSPSARPDPDRRSDSADEGGGAPSP